MPPLPNDKKRARESWVSTTPVQVSTPSRFHPNQLETAFLRGVPLRKLIIQLCNQAAMVSKDPISETLRVILTTPVEPVLTELGLALFKDQPLRVYPYSKMSRRQLKLLQDTVECVARDGVVASKQVGGGCILVGVCRESAASVDTLEVLVEFCKSLLHKPGSLGNGDNHQVRVSLCNIILQRIGGSIKLPSSSLLELERRVHLGKLD